ncbi:MAG: PQQ-binding-like beta-propeller repeat protein [Acidimicrobiia bacterium]|nr:PQQ-binding-like beta-propeller repeat protein [Acidimicrobiia bacterium]
MVPDADTLVGYQRESLVVEWRTPCRNPSWLTVILPARHGADEDVPVEVVRCGGVLAGIDGATGELLWERHQRLATNRTRVGPTVVVLQGDDDGILVLDLASGAVLGSSERFGSANVAADARYLYVSDSWQVVAFDLAEMATAKDLGEEIEVAAEGASGLYAARGSLFVRSNNHVVSRYDTPGENAVWKSERDPERLAWSDFVGSTEQTVLLVSTTLGLLTAYDIETGESLWRRGDLSAGSVSPGEDVVVTLGGPDRLRVHDDRSGLVLAEHLSHVFARPVVDDAFVYHLVRGRSGITLVATPLK